MSCPLSCPRPDTLHPRESVLWVFILSGPRCNADSQCGSPDVGVWAGTLLGAGPALRRDLSSRNWGTRPVIGRDRGHGRDMAWEPEPFLGLRFKVSLATEGRSLSQSRPRVVRYPQGGGAWP